MWEDTPNSIEVLCPNVMGFTPEEYCHYTIKRAGKGLKY